MTTTDRDELVKRLLEMAPESGKTIACVDMTTREMNATIRQAADRIQADAATIARMREALVQAREAMSDGDPYKDVARQMVDAALKGGDHGIAAMGEVDVR